MTKPGPRPGEDLGGGEDLAGLGLGHEPGGQVDRVAHDREGPPVGGPDLADEDRSPVDADPDGERAVVVHDLADRQQHAVLVVARGRRGAGGEDDLAAVPVGVGGQEGDLLALDRALDVS